MKPSLTKKMLLPVLLAPALFWAPQLQAQTTPGLRQMVCTQGTAQHQVESGNVKTTLLNGGDMFWNLNDARFEVPKGSGKHSVFAGAFWFGGVDVSNNLHLAVQTYRQGNPPDAGFWPGPLDANAQVTDQTCTSFDFIAKVHSSVVNPFIDYVSSGPSLPIPDSQIPQEIKNWPGKGNPFLNNISFFGGGQLAPFIDMAGDGIYDPRDGDYPLFPGDQCLYTIMNDAGGIKQPVSPTIGTEVHVMLYGFDAPNNPDVANTIFARYTFINRGHKTLSNCYFGQWVDFDLGNYQDDYVGSDSTRSMFYAYNGDDNDEGAAGYGLTPPAQGVIFLNNPLTNFMTYQNDNSPTWGNPQLDTDFYNYMRSFWRNGTTITYGNSGTGPGSQAKFMYSGNPETGTGWTEQGAGNLPDDTRGLGSHGPFSFAPGDVKVFDIAFPFAQGTSRLNSITELKQATDAVQAFYNNVVSAPAAAKTELSIQVYPNPANEAVEIVLPATTAAKVTYTLRDVTGRTVLQTITATTNQPQKIDVQQLPKGIYLLQVQAGDNSYSTKIIKQ